MSTTRGLKVTINSVDKTTGHKKVSFQRAFKGGQRWAATVRVRHTVPGVRCCDRGTLQFTKSHTSVKALKANTTTTTNTGL